MTRPNQGLFSRSGGGERETLGTRLVPFRLVKQLAPKVRLLSDRHLDGHSLGLSLDSNKSCITYYYMEESVLLETKPLVASIRHSIRDPSGVFSVCHAFECHIVQ